MVSAGRSAGLNLIFDADDTLWDSNIHFLRAQADFVETLARYGVDNGAVVRASIRRHELAVIETLGYGRQPFVIALHQVTRELIPSEHREAAEAEVGRIGDRLLTSHCEVLPGVEPTLSRLAQRHHLLLFTKGQPNEQIGKLERSGLRKFFTRVGIPVEKDETAYRVLLAQAELDPARTVMIGNSPRSDINPALRAGLRAVYIPHPHTWELEHEELDHRDERVVMVTGFPNLLQLF